MKLYIALPTLLHSFSCVVSAHYSFSRLLVNDTVSKDWQYIRKITRPTMPVWISDKTNTDIVCSYGALSNGAGVETARVLAGDMIGFGVQTEDPRYAIGIYHGGPAQAYLSQVLSGDLSTYQGDGPWFKIGEYGYKDRYRWQLDGLAGETYEFMNFTVPRSTPPGKYLMRAEQMNMRDPGYNGTQFFTSCAHIEVVGPGGGSPGPLVYFPGSYDPYDPSIAVPELISLVPMTGRDLRGYVNPGPVVWTGN